jgi:glucose/arabinose dehydrogenase
MASLRVMAAAALFLAGCKRAGHGSQAESAAGESSPASAASAPAAGAGTVGLSFEPAFGTDQENAFHYPVWFGEIPGRPDAYVVLERGSGTEDAHAWLLRREGGAYARKIFVTVPVQTTSSSSDERGLLGFAFHPHYAKNRKYYLNYIRKRRAGDNGDSTVIEERTADSTLLGDAGLPPRRVLAFAQPYANHNGGTLAFGPKDGFLYIGTGDGGSAGDPHGNGQNLSAWLGKMLRIDVDDTSGGQAYGIPRDNPFAGAYGGEARKEIWAYGLRNPWKWSFDPVTGDLWAGDVGQNTYEEVDRVGRGDNLGWNRMEGSHCFEPPQGCDGKGFKAPEADFNREEASCITGGYVYRGDTASAWYGAYLFGDFDTRNFFALPRGHVAGRPAVKVGRLPDQPSSFGVDARGGLYLVGYSSGIIYRVALPSAAP